jgi:hypothetical protein
MREPGFEAALQPNPYGNEDQKALKSFVATGRKPPLTAEAEQNYRYFLSYSGVKLPLKLLSPLEPGELENRNTYFRARYDAADRIVSCEKMVYGEVELAHHYEYGPGGTLARAEIRMSDDDPTEVLFDENGAPLKA